MLSRRILTRSTDGALSPWPDLRVSEGAYTVNHQIVVKLVANMNKACSLVSILVPSAVSSNCRSSKRKTPSHLAAARRSPTYRKYGIKHLDKVAKADLSSNIASTLQAGCFVGCFIASWLADRYGRKWALQCAGLVTIVGCVIQAAASGSLAAMYIGR